MIGVATLTQNATYCTDEPRNATRLGADKTTLSVATPDERSDENSHDAKGREVDNGKHTYYLLQTLPNQTK
jgi:hypothetical protein